MILENTIICLMGPTASGKTQLAFELAELLPCEIISVDSAMVYRGMDIGTAKPSKEELAKVPHHLIDIRDPSESYSAADFRRDALTKIEGILSREKTPLLVGGTMLYFKALQQGLSVLPSADVSVRERLSQQAALIGWPAMHEKLSMVDPITAKHIHQHDAQRIQRALEVFELTGKAMSELQKLHQPTSLPYRMINLAIVPSDRLKLQDRIEKRFAQMLARGFVEEVRILFKRGDLHRDLPSMRSVGYRQVWDYLDHRITFDEMKDLAIIATRQLAKRQWTWLRNWPDLYKIDMIL
jgi:tRNA dimethylallyltransferase